MGYWEHGDETSGAIEDCESLGEPSEFQCLNQSGPS
jgi:hypothetical protein